MNFVVNKGIDYESNKTYIMGVNYSTSSRHANLEIPSDNNTRFVLTSDNKLMLYINLAVKGTIPTNTQILSFSPKTPSIEVWEDVTERLNGVANIVPYGFSSNGIERYLITQKGKPLKIYTDVYTQSNGYVKISLLLETLQALATGDYLYGFIELPYARGYEITTFV